jgi:hypothetical protein
MNNNVVSTVRSLTASSEAYDEDKQVNNINTRGGPVLRLHSVSLHIRNMMDDHRECELSSTYRHSTQVPLRG